MRAINQWCENKPKHIAMMSQIVLSSANWLFNFMQSVKFGDQAINVDDIPNVQQWLKLYQDHHRFNRKLLQIAIDHGGLPKFFASFIYSLEMGYFQPMLADDGTLIIKPARKDLIPGATDKEWIDYNVGLQYILEQARTKSFQEIASSGYNEPLTRDDKANAITRKIPEVIFIARVWLPCLLLYRDIPLMLLRRARRGDMDALEKILRLDKATISDPKISEIYFKASLQKNKSQFNTLNKALQASVKGKLTSQKIKISLAALVSLMTEGFNYRLSSTDIEKLYHAIAQDMGDDDLIDTDIPESQWTFSKAIQRERELWARLLRPGQKADQKMS